MKKKHFISLPNQKPKTNEFTVFKYVFHGQKLPRSCFAPIFLLDLFLSNVQTICLHENTVHLKHGSQVIKKKLTVHKKKILQISHFYCLKPMNKPCMCGCGLK